MKKLIIAAALVCFSFNATAHGRGWKTFGAIVIGGAVAGAIVPRYYSPPTYYPPGTNGYPKYDPYTGTTIHCPSCAPSPMPPTYIDNAGVQYNYYGHPVCMARPVYDAVGTMIGYAPGC